MPVETEKIVLNAGSGAGELHQLLIVVIAVSINGKVIPIAGRIYERVTL